MVGTHASDVIGEIARLSGQIMKPAIVSNINTELFLLGVASADIVMTGGGPGASAARFAFKLENVVMF